MYVLYMFYASSCLKIYNSPHLKNFVIIPIYLRGILSNEVIFNQKLKYPLFNYHV